MKSSTSDLMWFLGILIVGLAIVLIRACVVYDDWTCAFAHCVKVKP